jgi:hypothetical protein
MFFRVAGGVYLTPTASDMDASDRDCPGTFNRKFTGELLAGLKMINYQAHRYNRSDLRIH